MGNTYGKVFKITTYGESHGKAIGVTIDGCPAGLKIDESFIQKELERRKPGQSKIVTQRQEADQMEILSGVFEGITTGAPVHMVIWNKDQKSKDYDHIAKKFRPSHADYVYHQKYGLRDYRGGGRSSARETVARVASGAVAKIFLLRSGIHCYAYVSQVGNLALNKSYQQLNMSKIDSNDVRCPDTEMAQKMYDYINQVRKKGDTIGGIITGVITGVPVGLGEPVFDKLHAELGKAMLSINAVKGFEYGSGFNSANMNGSAHNDSFENRDGNIRTKTNFSGGIQGGISNGEDIYFKLAFKPVATIMNDQPSVDIHGKATVVSGKGRHDPCVVPRAVPIVEAMSALVVADFLLRNRHTRV